jgi:glycosyltransferase involved in cell wall biosynthesis
VRLALLGAFSFPSLLGSQRFFAEQARALADAGCQVTLVCYGRGDSRIATDLPVASTPPWLSPRRLRAGPSPAKPLADLALRAQLIDAERKRPFDAVLAHNAEAALVARTCRRSLQGALIYVAHTLFSEELETYLPAVPTRISRRLGRSTDRAAARGADAVLVLSAQARRALAPVGPAPLEHIPPGRHPEPPPGDDQVESACARHGLPRSHYAVYAGNLDAYQDLPLLDAAAAELPELPVVVVTHDRAGGSFRHLKCVRTDSPEEARALLYGARVAALPRRRGGGFPIKLLDYMEAGLPIVAFASLADTLEAERSGWLLGDDADALAFAHGLGACASDPELARRLGEGARRCLAEQHAWPGRIAETLALVRRARTSRSRPREPGAPTTTTGR